MLSFDDAASYLDDVVDSLPEELFRQLNGGVSLLPDFKTNLNAPSLYIMGEYIRNPQMGRYIVIYYGSFQRVHRNDSDDFVRQRLKEVLIHELTHHNESLAGDNDLILKDNLQREYYLKTGKHIDTKDINLYGSAYDRSKR